MYHDTTKQLFEEIADALKQLYNEEGKPLADGDQPITVYMDTKPQGHDEPCFFVKLVEMRQEADAGSIARKLQRRKYSFAIYYFPKDSSTSLQYAQCYRVGDELANYLYYLPVLDAQGDAETLDTAEAVGLSNQKVRIAQDISIKTAQVQENTDEKIHLIFFVSYHVTNCVYLDQVMMEKLSKQKSMIEVMDNDKTNSGS